MPEADLLLGVFQYFGPVLPSKLSGCITTDAYVPHLVILEAVVVVNIKGNHHILHVHSHFHTVGHCITELLVVLWS